MLLCLMQPLHPSAAICLWLLMNEHSSGVVNDSEVEADLGLVHFYLQWITS